MNGEQPEWDKADPEGSLRRQAAFLNEKARFTFLTDKFHTELFFLYKEDGQGAMLQPPPKVDRDTFVASLCLTQPCCADLIYGGAGRGDRFVTDSPP